MACLYPKPAYLGHDGKVVFTRREKALGSTAFIHIRCGMCNGCKFDHARDWAIRCYHESQMHRESHAVTLTYREEQLPPHGTLCKRDLQLFFKRLRKRLAAEFNLGIRYFAAGEYGTKKGRPHYHLIIFGWMPGQRVLVRRSAKGHPQYYSKILDEAWQKGDALWSDFDQSMARYIAHYTADKLKSYAKEEIDPETGLRPYEVLDRDGCIQKLTPEFQVQSNKPGIGIPWLEENWRECFPVDSVVMGGKEYPPPRAYYKWLQEEHPEVFKTVREARRIKALDIPFETGVRIHQLAEAREKKLSRYDRPTHEKGKI